MCGVYNVSKLCEPNIFPFHTADHILGADLQSGPVQTTDWSGERDRCEALNPCAFNMFFFLWQYFSSGF